MRTLHLKAPAKINLYLNVLAKRPDGFHNIETIFEKIDLCDEISLSRRWQGLRVFCRPANIPQRKNLAFKAAQALLAEVKRSDGVDIRIAKKIPLAAGLGGGSSDAASVLLGLNKLLLLRLSRSQLQRIAARLGADVPFFLLPNFRAIGRGKGEILTPLKLKRKNWYVLVVSRNLAVSTRKMYQDPRITLTKPRGSVKITLCALEKGDLSSLNKYSYNSFQRILEKKYRQILEIKQALKSSGARTAMISGSGPCVFGVAQTRKEAMRIQRALRARNKNWQVIVARTGSNNK